MNKKQQISHIIYNIAKSGFGIDDRVIARAIGTVLYDVPTTLSGKVSSSLLCEYGYRPAMNNCCKEHYNSRQNSGYHIIDMVREGLTIKYIEEYVSEASRVHLTTRDENIRLSKIQNHEATRVIGWRAQYNLAGITLVKDPGTLPRRLKIISKKSK